MALAVLLMGPAGAGKDTAAQTLCEEAGYTRFALADPLRELLLATWNTFTAMAAPAAPVPAPQLTWHACTDPLAKATPLPGVCLPPSVLPHAPTRDVTPRALLQWLGTDVARTCLGDDVWVHTLLARVRAARAPRIVVTDVRFENEVTALSAALRADGFAVVLVRIMPPLAAAAAATAAPASAATGDVHASEHASERGYASAAVDVQLINDKSAPASRAALRLGILAAQACAH